MKLKKALHLIRVTALLIIATTIIIKNANAQIADTVLTNGQFYTMNSVNPWAEAVAFVNGTIIYTGDMSGVSEHIDAETEVINLEGKFAMPSFVESHLHPLSTSYAFNFTAVLYDLFTHEAYIQEITTFAEAHPQMEGILGNGFSTSLYGPLGPGKESLDAIDSERPIGIVSDDIHAMWANSKALEMAGITASTPNPPGGVIVKDPDTGEPTGLLQEMPAMSLVWNILPAPTKEDYRTSLLWGQNLLNRAGITTAHDAWMEFEPNFYEAYNELSNEGLLTVRFRGSWYIDPNAEFGYIDEINFAINLLQSFTHPHFQVNSFKFLADGTIEEATALLTEPYSDQPGYYGIKNWADSDMANAFTAVDNAGYQIHVHVIGDSAAALTLDAIEQLDTSQNRHSIAHLQLINPEDVSRMGQLNISALMTPYWMVKNEAYWDVYLPALGSERADNTYPLRSMYDAGINVTVASDWPTTTPKPILAIYNGMTRSDLGGEQLPPSSQTVSLEQMLNASTITGAYANVLEDEIGTIEVGKKADIVVLSGNLLEIETDEIPGVEVLMTFFEGNLVYDNLSLGISNPKNGDASFILEQNQPNPFDSSTTIHFTLKKQQKVKLSILDFNGKEIEVLIEENMDIGNHSIEFNGDRLASGQYFYKIETDDFNETRKMILQK